MFVCNPRMFQIDKLMLERLPANAIDGWGAGDYQRHFTRGDLGLLRVGQDRRTRAELVREGGFKLQPGIYAICEVISEPTLELNRVNNDLWRAEGLTGQVENRVEVPIRYLWWSIDSPLLMDQLKSETPDIDRSILNGRRTTCFPISEDDFWTIINRLPVAARNAIQAPRLRDSDADMTPFDPENETDARRKIMRAIRERRGQKKFRDSGNLIVD